MPVEEAEENWAKPKNLTADNTDDTDFHGLKPQRGIVPKMRITC
jgi:hypothetical protein